MKKLTIIHYFPIEYFPPVLNLLNYLPPNLTNQKVSVFTCYNSRNRIPYQNISINVKRFTSPCASDNSILRIFKYFQFFISTLLSIVIERPETILYYESISAWPAYIYKRYFNRKSLIFIHYHEYASPEWYEKYMKLVKKFHLLEREFLYNEAAWISQTNDSRLDLFKNDNPLKKYSNLKVMPNYPPLNWKNKINLTKKDDPKKIVYIGSLAFESTFIKEFCDWILRQNFFTFDIYAFNLHDDVKAFLLSLQSEKITYYPEGVEYDQIPVVLKNYSIGIILHKAFNENYKFNATNKLFEYLACDLDVWFPQEMLGCYEYITQNTFPQVIPVDFENLEQFDWKAAINKKNLMHEPSVYFCEEVYEELIKELTST